MFDMGEPPREFGVGGAKRGLRVHLKASSQIDYGKEKIADLVGQRLAWTAAELGFDLVDFLPEFGEHCSDIIPVEPHLSGLLLQFQRAGQRGKRERNMAKRAGRGLGRQPGRRTGLDAPTLFVGLYPAPQRFDRRRVQAVGIAEDVRMAADEP